MCLVLSSRDVSVITRHAACIVEEVLAFFGRCLRKMEGEAAATGKLTFKCL